MSLLLICGILGLFVNTLPSDDEYSLRNSENLEQPIQKQLREKKQLFLNFFRAFLKSASIFEYFEKNVDPYSSFISEITDCKRCSYIIV